MIAEMRLVSNVASVFARDVLSVLLVSDLSSCCLGWRLPSSSAWWVDGFTGFHAFGAGDIAAGVSRISSMPKLNPVMSKYGFVVYNFGSVLGL